MIGVGVVALDLGVDIWSIETGVQAKIYARRAKTYLALDRSIGSSRKELAREITPRFAFGPDGRICYLGLQSTPKVRTSRPLSLAAARAGPRRPCRVLVRKSRPVSIEFLESQPTSNVARGRLDPIRIAVLDKFGRRFSRLTVRTDSDPHRCADRGPLRSRERVARKTVDGIATFRRLAFSSPGKYEQRVVVGRKHLLFRGFCNRFSTPFPLLSE